MRFSPSLPSRLTKLLTMGSVAPIRNVGTSNTRADSANRISEKVMKEACVVFHTN